MSAGAVAGLIAAGAFLVLALFGSWALLKLAKIFDEVADRVRQTDRAIDEGTDRVRQAGTTVDEVNSALSKVNVELTRVDAITANVQSITGNMSALTSVFAATLGGPAVKVAAFSYGVRKASAKRARGEIETRVRQEMREQRGRGARRGSSQTGRRVRA
jgi:uncharacterized protein YoxC